MNGEEKEIFWNHSSGERWIFQVKKKIWHYSCSVTSPHPPSLVEVLRKRRQTTLVKRRKSVNVRPLSDLLGETVRVGLMDTSYGKIGLSPNIQVVSKWAANGAKKIQTKGFVHHTFLFQEGTIIVVVVVSLENCVPAECVSCLPHLWDHHPWWEYCNFCSMLGSLFEKLKGNREFFSPFFFPSSWRWECDINRNSCS